MKAVKVVRWEEEGMKVAEVLRKEEEMKVVRVQ